MSGLRVVGGIWKGRAIEAPVGRRVTRPTTARTRETIASIVLSSFDLDLSGVAVLDAFAGSGALGLEMLSRGAASCTFVDGDRAAVSRMRRSIVSLGAIPRTQVILGDVFKVAHCKMLHETPFELVLLDPPYAMAAPRLADLVKTLRLAGKLAPQARIVYERAAKAPPLCCDAMTLATSSSHGGTAVDLFVVTDEEVI